MLEIENPVKTAATAIARRFVDASVYLKKIVVVIEIFGTLTSSFDRALFFSNLAKAH